MNRDDKKILIKLTTYIPASPTEIAQVIQRQSKQWSLNGEVNFKSQLDEENRVMMLQQLWTTNIQQNRGTQRFTYAISLDENGFKQFNRSLFKVEKYFITTLLHGEHINQTAAVKEFSILRNKILMQ